MAPRRCRPAGRFGTALIRRGRNRQGSDPFMAARAEAEPETRGSADLAVAHFREAGGGDAERRPFRPFPSTVIAADRPRADRSWPACAPRGGPTASRSDVDARFRKRILRRPAALDVAVARPGIRAPAAWVRTGCKATAGPNDAPVDGQRRIIFGFRHDGANGLDQERDRQEVKMSRSRKRRPIRPDRPACEGMAPAAGGSAAATARMPGIFRQRLHGVPAGRNPASPEAAMHLAGPSGNAPRVRTGMQESHGARRAALGIDAAGRHPPAAAAS